jgi:hypothetical protein
MLHSAAGQRFPFNFIHSAKQSLQLHKGNVNRAASFPNASGICELKEGGGKERRAVCWMRGCGSPVPLQG